MRPWPTSRLPNAARLFSSSAAARGHTSNIGKAPIKFPPTVTFAPSPTALSVTGPRGTTSVPLEPYMAIAFPAEDTLALSVQDAEQKKQRSMWGLTRTLINNAVVGMTEGFTVPVYLVGVGYRAALEEDPRGTTNGGSGMRLNMKLGFSHTVYEPVPAHIKAEVPSATKIVLSCTDKHLLGLFAAKVRKWRPPEPYKGKVCGSTRMCLGRRFVIIAIHSTFDWYLFSPRQKSFVVQTIEPQQESPDGLCCIENIADNSTGGTDRYE